MYPNLSLKKASVSGRWTAFQESASKRKKFMLLGEIYIHCSGLPCFNHLKHSGKHTRMFHLLLIISSSAFCCYGFLMFLPVNSDYFLKRY
jgi:hypothetical protein